MKCQTPEAELRTDRAAIMSTNSQYHFFEVQNPGQRIEAGRLTALRTHVRRAIVRNKRARPVGHIVKVVTPQDLADKKKNKQRAAKERMLDIKRPPSCHHPFAVRAAGSIDMDVKRLDQLFKSGMSCETFADVCAKSGQLRFESPASLSSTRVKSIPTERSAKFSHTALSLDPSCMP
jgi:hypothetical protein